MTTADRPTATEATATAARLMTTTGESVRDTLTRTRTLVTLLVSTTLVATALAVADEPPPFRPFGSFSLPTTEAAASSASSLIWQPLPLRATFRPLSSGGAAGGRNRGLPAPPAPPSPPAPPTPPEPLALVVGREHARTNSLNHHHLSPPPPPSSSSIDANEPDSDSTSSSLGSSRFGSGASVFTPTLAPPTPTEASPTLSSARPLASLSSSLDDDDQPTRQPSNRFRPTRAPSVDDDHDHDSRSGSPIDGAFILATTTTTNSSAAAAAISLASSAPTTITTTTGADRISNECYECICEASTNCNANSRCQTSDVRHTRCGLFLISYDQWLSTGLSRELVSREALARDAAADERAFYECVTSRDCAERLLEIFLSKNRKDCDKDGRIDCYDLAAIHHSGLEQCASESLLDSQYWSDFNACFGFGR